MTECFACGASFDVKFEEEDTKLNFCPHCGQETVEELDMLDGEMIDQDVFDEWE